MNTPAARQGTGRGDISRDALHPDFAAKMAALMEMTDRDGYREPTEGHHGGRAYRRGFATGSRGIANLSEALFLQTHFLFNRNRVN